MTSVEERFVSGEELRRLLSQPTPPANLPVLYEAPSRTFTPLELAWQKHLQRADEGEGFWGERPASLTALKEHIAEKAKSHVFAPVNLGEWLYGAPVMALIGFIYGGLWLARRPVTRATWQGGPPTLAQLRAEIVTKGTFGRIYGTAILALHAAAYPTIYQIQRPARMALALFIVGVFFLTIRLGI